MSGAVSGAAAGASAGSLAGPIGTAVGAIGGALIGALGSNSSAKKQYKYQSALQAQAAELNYKYAEKTARNSPTWNRAGLESAGYNPMLAVQNATNGANSSWTSAGQATAPDYAGAISQGVANAQSFQRLKNETNVADSTEDMNYATADKAKAEANESVLRSKFIPDSMKAKIARDTAEAKNLENQIHIAEEKLKLQATGLTIQQEANAIASEKNEIERKGNPFRTVRDFGDKYNWSPRQFGSELGRRFAKDHFGRFYKGE